MVFVLYVKRIISNQKDEMDILLSSYKDIMDSESEITRLEIQVILELFPDSLSYIPEINNEILPEPWKISLDTVIESFRTITDNLQLK